MSGCRVLHVLDHSLPLQSGYVFRTLAILTEQRKLGWNTSQITGPKQGGGGGEEEVEGWLFHRTAPPWGKAGLSPLLEQAGVIRGLTRRIQEVAKQEKPDLIHAHSPALNGVAAVLAARRLALPLVYEVRAFWEDAAVSHGSTREGSLRYRATRAMENWVFHRANQVVAICDGLAGEIISRGISANRITVVRNGVPTPPPPPPPPPPPGAATLATLAEQWDLKDRQVVGFIGSFYHYEGLDLLLQAWPTILAKQPRAVLLLVGGGPEEKALQDLATRLGLADSVRFTGRVPHKDVDAFQALVDLFVFPRRRIRLTELVTPLKPLEAMAAKKPVLASDVAGHKEWVRHGENGFLFPADDITSLAEQVIHCLTNPEKNQSVASQAQSWVTHSLTWASQVAHYRDVYGKAIAEKK